MRTKIFEHEFVDLGYDKLVREDSSSGRVYATPKGKYPSITSVLSILSEDSIREWRKRVGEEEANRVSQKASRRGTALHTIVEKYLDNDEDYLHKAPMDSVQMFKDIRPILDTRVGKIYGQELPLFSDYLGVAGSTDCVAQFDGVDSIIDFKTSKRVKSKDDITSYFMQEAAYAIMWEERTGRPIVNLVTIMAVDHEHPIVFKEHRDNWVDPLMDTIKEYKRRKFFGA